MIISNVYQHTGASVEQYVAYIALGLPRENLLFLSKDGLTDSIGLPISELYLQLDPSLQSIVSADGGVTRRTDEEIYNLAVAAGNTAEMLVDDDKKILLIYADGTSQEILDDAAAWIARRPDVVDALYMVDNLQMLDSLEMI